MVEVEVDIKIKIIFILSFITIYMGWLNVNLSGHFALSFKITKVGNL